MTMDVLELRQYTCRPGQREALIELFDRELVETQEMHGARILGQFRDLDDPDRFVWLRGFGTMESRRAALEGFYGGQVWARHREAANATMVDSDDVLLLRPVTVDRSTSWLGPWWHDLQDLSPFQRLPVGRRRPDAPDDQPCDVPVLAAWVWPLAGPLGGAALGRVTRQLNDALGGLGEGALGLWVTEQSANTFPALPVREGEQVLVWLLRYPSVRHLAARREAVARVGEELGPARAGAPLVLRLGPTDRSLLR
ncbi:MAG: NIPSNAP family protein [Oryzihumus sp.]